MNVSLHSNRTVPAASNILLNHWRKKYLPTLTQRKGGLLKEKNFEKGDLVVLQNKNVPRSHWLFGRVTEIHPDCDNVVCIVKLRTPIIEIIQTANKLYLIEGSNDLSF